MFENSIVCHVFYAIALGAARDGLLFVVCGFWGLFCFGLPGSHLCGGWVGLWSGFLDCMYWLEPFLVLIGFVWRV